MASSSHHHHHQQPSSTSSSPEPYASLRYRNEIAQILASYERLSWFSFQRNETIHQTRLHFQNLLAGFEASSDEHLTIIWPEDFSKHPKSFVKGVPGPGSIAEKQMREGKGKGKEVRRSEGNEIRRSGEKEVRASSSKVQEGRS